jgi:2-C-methyl-D-erythritol 4-phosphate cytidylyltransferase
MHPAPPHSATVGGCPSGKRHHLDHRIVSHVSVIVLAAGSGSRFGDQKQFLELSPGVRLVDAALQAALSATESVILVLPPGYSWERHGVEITVAGGPTRRDSVAAGLAAVPVEAEVVVVHDAAHPLAPAETFTRLLRLIGSGADAAVPVLPVGDVVKRRGQDGRLTTVGRDGLGLAQMPMAFTRSALVGACREQASDDLPCWEDSMLIEKTGGLVASVAGSSRNIHVVTPEDLDLVRALAAKALHDEA